MELNLPERLEAQQESFPFPAPFILTSVERNWCRFQPNRNAAIVFVKRRHLEENLKTIAQEIGMDETEQKKFLDWWCCANGEEIRAEGDHYFNLRYRAENWVEKRKSQSKQQQQSRLEQYAESARQAFGVSPGDKEPGNIGYAILPDEQ